MSFFNKPDDIDKWKDKYLNLLDEQEQSQKSTVEKEQLLCKTIVRISIAASGLDPQLDPSLKRIRDHLKNGINNQKLKTELENFIEVLARLNDASTIKPLDGSLLFNFLLQHFQDEEQQRNLKQIQTKSFYDATQLFVEVNKVIAPQFDLAKHARVSEPQTLEENIDTQSLGKQLLRLLDSIEIPVPFCEQAQALKHQLSATISVSSFNQLLVIYIDFLIKIENYPLPEQQDIDRFLSHISEQLTSLSHTVTGAAAATKESTLHRDKLDLSVHTQMQELQSTALNATKLEPLKADIKLRLHNIANEIKEHAQHEVVQRQQTQQQLDELTAKVNAMERESNELKAKLDMAKTQALRDLLTGLPNRVAYKERIEVEIARWKRNKTPLSIAVWDVDRFKNINDTCGHKAGDKALVIISKLLLENCRESDFVSRFGGEEFVMLLPNTPKESALILTEQLRKRIEKASFNANGTTVSITISCGITEFIDNDTDETAFERADQALYKAKQLGRNQCCLG